MFLRGACERYGEVIKNSGKLPWITLQEVLDIYYDGFGDYEMKRINKEIIDVITSAQQEVLRLIEINEVPWDSLRIDTLLKVANSIKNFTNSSFSRAYFAKYENEIIYCFSNGRTSKTNNASLVSWKYATPEE